MKTKTLYKITPPIGTIMVPKETMTESELRGFIPQLIQDSDQAEIWLEKVAKDPVDNLIEWLTQSGYKVIIERK